MQNIKKRNIKKRNVTQRDANSQKFTLKIPKDVSYDFPHIDKIAAGRYVSRIAYVMRSKTSTNKDAFDVCYRIVNFYDYIAYLKGEKTEKECKIYKIRQRYPFDSESERKFIEAMYAMGFDDEFELQEVVGVEEVFELEFIGKNKIGSIGTRVPYDVIFTNSENISDADE